MSAAVALKAGHTAGIRFEIDGNDLVLEASAPPPPAVIDLLSRHKAEVVALLRPAKDGWSAEDWQVFFDERAAIVEFDGGLSRAEAEAHAFDCCVVEWLNHNPEHSPAGPCLDCGDCDHTDDPLLPYGTEISGRGWLHSSCWRAWHEGRKSEATAFLEAIGIRWPRGLYPRDVRGTAE
jgi:hypothetical protein